MKAKFLPVSCVCLLLLAVSSGSSARGATGDENWDTNFGMPGADGIVDGLVLVGTNLHVCGSFTSIGGVRATNIANWDGESWSNIQDGSGCGCLVAPTGI